MKNNVRNQLEHILNQASNEDISTLSKWLEGFEKKQSGDLSTYLGATLHMEKKLSDDSCTISIPITPYIHNTLHIPHGGILAVMLDTAMGVLANHSLPEEFAAVTMNLSINYLATATEGHLHAHATFSHKGRQTMVVTGEITDDNGKKLAVGNGSFFVVPRNR